MTELLYKSIKFASSTSDDTIEELCYRYNIAVSEFKQKTIENNEYDTFFPIIEEVEESEIILEDSNTIPVTSTDSIIHTPTIVSKQNSLAKEETEDSLRVTLDEAYSKIVEEAKGLLETSFELTGKELKEITSTLQIIENIKYPKLQKQGLEVDMSKGIVRFLSENMVDDL